LRTIVAGSRTAANKGYVAQALRQISWVPTVVLSGGARGADRLGEEWAKTNGIPIELYPADWDRHGKSAGYIRNSEMADKAEALIAIWDGQSKGTQHMVKLAEQKGLTVFVLKINP